MKRRKNIKLKTSKAALSASTAIFMVGSIVSSATGAAQVNEFRIISDKNYVQAGDNIVLSVELVSGDTGTSGFSFDLHFDPAKVRPNIPDEDDCYLNNGSFVVMSSYNTQKGIVRFAGANLSGKNIKRDSKVAVVSFTVLDGAEGDIDYWLDVDADVAFDGENFFDAAYNAPSYSAPYTVNGPEKKRDTISSSNISDSAPDTSEPVYEFSSKYNIDALPDEELVLVSNTPDTDQGYDVSPEPVVIVIDSDDDDDTEEYYEPQPDSSYSTQSDSDAYSVYESPDTAAEISGTSDERAVIKQSDEQYSFNISDYVSDNSGSYDIRIKVNSTGFVDGGIGMMNNSGNWDSTYCNTAYGDDTWIFEDVRPSECWDQVFLQIYSMQDGVEFSIDGIEFISRSYNSDIKTLSAVSTEEEPDVKKEISAQSSDTSSDADVAEQEDQAYRPDDSMAEEVSVIKDKDSDDSSESTDKEVSSETSSSPDYKDSSSAEKTESVNENKTESKTEEKPADKEIIRSNGDAEKITETVRNQKAQASTANTKSNPNTGVRRKNGFLFSVRSIAAAVILYSLFAMVYDRAFGDRKRR